MKNKINEIIVNDNEELSSEIILKYLKEKKSVQIKSKYHISNNKLNYINLEKPGVILNSSGSQNLPKLCYHPIENLNQSAHYCGIWLKEQGFDLSKIIIFNTLPLSHISGLMPLWRSKSWECEYINISPTLIKESKDLLQKTLTINGKARKTLITSLVPTQLYRLLLNKEGINWLSLFDLIWIGGASISQNILKKCIQEKINLSPCYGATETAAMISSLKPEDFLNGNLSDGEIFKDINIRINEKNLIEIKTKRIGKEVSQSSKILDFTKKDGWWESGDIGKILKNKNNKYIKVYGRIDNTINSGGEIVFLDSIKIRIEDFIKDQNLPVENFLLQKITDSIWGQRYKILINFKEQIEDKKLLQSMKKLRYFSKTFQRFEQPLMWIICDREQTKNDNYFKNWKNIV